MARLARIVFNPLRSSLVNLPISIYGTLVRQQIRPQSLAIHLSLTRQSATSNNSNGERKSAYVGWSGLAASPSLTPNTDVETIEIDPQFASSIGFKSGDIVEIGLLYDLPPAKTVSAEPVTVDDWEIIETHASYVERNLIAQVRVASVGQELGVWVFGQTRIGLRVGSLEPQTHKHSAALLVNDTEVIIAPKSRAKPSTTSSAGTSENTPVSLPPHFSTTGRSTIQSRCRAVLRAVPSKQFPALSTEESKDGEGRTCWVSRATFEYLTQQRVQKRRQGGGTVVNVKLMKPPGEPAKDGSPSTNTPTVGPKATQSPRNQKDGETGNANEMRTFLLWDDRIPESHVAISGAFWRVKEGDIVCITPLDKGDSSSGETSGANSSMIVDTPTPVLPNHAGTEPTIKKCTEHILRCMALQSTSDGCIGAGGILITGGTGTGKSSIASAVAMRLQNDARVNARPLILNMQQHAEDSVGTIKALFESTYAKAVWHRPSLIVFDDLDKVVGAELEHSDSFRSRQIAALFLDIFSSHNKLANSATSVALVVTASSDAALHPMLTSAHLFSMVVGLKAPGVDVRKDVLASIVESGQARSSGDVDSKTDVNITNVVALTEGYSISDLGDFVANARYSAALRLLRGVGGGGVLVERQPLALRPEDFSQAHAEFTPFSLRDVGLQKSGTSWSDIGGLTETRRVLRETLEWPTKYGPIFAQSPLRLRSGLLLYGYPGCGKTLLASAVAKECGLNFIGVKGPELLNKYIGASEKSVRDLFERASAAKPCVLFFDEFDSIAPKRGHDSTGVTDRVVNQMLTQMDGAEGLSGVYVLAATSRPDLIDSALLRPGRLDKAILCDMPNKEERREILEVVSRKLKVDEDVDWEYYAERTEGFSGADLQALVYNAHLDVIHSAMDGVGLNNKQGGDSRDGSSSTGAIDHVEIQGVGKKSVVSQAEGAKLMNRLRRTVESSEDKEDPASSEVDNGSDEDARRVNVVLDEHLRRSLETTRPSVSVEERRRLARIYGEFVSDRDGGMPQPPEDGIVGSRATLA